MFCVVLTFLIFFLPINNLLLHVLCCFSFVLNFTLSKLVRHFTDCIVYYDRDREGGSSSFWFCRSGGTKIYKSSFCRSTKNQIYKFSQCSDLTATLKTDLKNPVLRRHIFKTYFFSINMRLCFSDFFLMSYVCSII